MNAYADSGARILRQAGPLAWGILGRWAMLEGTSEAAQHIWV